MQYGIKNTISWKLRDERDDNRRPAAKKKVTKKRPGSRPTKLQKVAALRSHAGREGAEQHRCSRVRECCQIDASDAAISIVDRHISWAVLPPCMQDFF